MQLPLQQQLTSQRQQRQRLLLQSTALVAGACRQSAQDAAAMALLAMLVMSSLRHLLAHLLGLVLPALPALGMQAAETSKGAGWVTGTLLRLLQKTLQQQRTAQAFSSSTVTHAAQAGLRVQQQMGLLLRTAMQVAPLCLWPGLAQVQGRRLQLWGLLLQVQACPCQQLSALQLLSWLPWRQQQPGHQVRQGPRVELCMHKQRQHSNGHSCHRACRLAQEHRRQRVQACLLHSCCAPLLHLATLHTSCTQLRP
jgi:hypothetical protein